MWRSLNKLQLKTFTSAVRAAAHWEKTCNRSVSPAKRDGAQCFPQICYQKESGDNGRQDQDRAKSHRAFYFVKNDCLEAFGWSGIIFLSWYIWFPCCPRRITSNPAERHAYKCLPKRSVDEYASLVKCLSSVLLSSNIKYVLPKVNATKLGSPSLSETNENEELRKGCENLEFAHKKVTSSLKNWLGTECMQEGKYKEAYSHFSEAASSDHAAALFNLGLCHELGLGAEQSFKRAAELYKKASDLGHATAKYNLGVFYVHGWGGIIANSTMAQQLFIAAAKMGQNDARRALDWDDDKANQESDEDTDDEQLTVFQRRPIIEPKDNDSTDLWLKVLNINLNNLNESSSVEDPPCQRVTSYDSGINDMSPTDDVGFIINSQLKT